MDLTNNTNHNGAILVGTIRTRLMYRSRDAMFSNWIGVFPNELLPDDHITVPTEKVKTFLESLAQPQRGRSAAITNAAVELLREINEPAKEAVEVSGNAADLSSVTTLASNELSEQNNGQAKPQAASESWFKRFTALDIVFYANMAVADYGLVFLLKEMGGAWALIYTLVSFQALQMAKNRYSQVTAGRGITAVWVLEIFAFFIHLAMFNLRAWQAAKDGQMPFSPWENVTYPFWIAVALAALFSSAAIYAVSTTLALTKEQVEAENFEEKHGIKY